MTIAESLGLRRLPYRILTIDGGGVRGIIPVVWLERLERHLEAPAHTHFDMFAGTSIGAIIACALAMGMNAREVHDIWVNSAHLAFAKPGCLRDYGRRWANRAGLAAKYDSAGLEDMLHGIFHDLCLGELRTPTLALSYDIQAMQVHVFSSAREDHKPLPVWEVCRASTAAPLFFDPHMMVCDDSGTEHPMADGGLTANNPVVLAISEAVCQVKGKAPVTNLEHVVVASFGTGAPPEGQTTVPKTIFGHGSAILQALMTGATGTDHVTARTLLPPENYWRFQTSISDRLSPLDEVDNIDALQAVALAHLADGADHRLAQLARRLQGKPLERRWWEGRHAHEVAS
ncbi:patatin-like phospholipase family protein [Imhoffiella purpurea]|uniref:Patatin n=1 Tax=Imhoffiella purpurea TaxID=1249627 RepID=W9VU56_9GAMM|nr:patatin-like phospholipase family protein [Imhoffiella purpurea]EXJ13885.1 Patatin [Imhoffiella purpurea]